jgi:hypothetical protein
MSAICLMYAVTPAAPSSLRGGMTARPTETVRTLSP